jgi:glycosyltransferase involved in cell wall biosynthesis
MAAPPSRCKLVFVSAYLRDGLPRYIGRPLPLGIAAVIHNPINTDLFRYVAKPAAQRLKILSIRPYTSQVYANDLAVHAIGLLAQRPCFSALSFHLIGDGPLFDATVAPLRDHPNVILERRFLQQSEIAALHQDYGVFLIPTRMDSHGVSRDEAMASGLVPVTSRVAAIPEFVDETCAMLTPPDDAHAIAVAIEHLHDHPDHFTTLSAAAAARVRHQAGHEITIPQELALLRGIT